MEKTIKSLTPPENTHVMWLDVSQEVAQLKTYINGEWVVVNDDTKNNEEIVNKVLEKIDKDFESYIKKEDADKAYAPKSDLEKKVDKVEGKGLSTEDYTSAEKTKLAGVYDPTESIEMRQFLASPANKEGTPEFRKIELEDLPEDIMLDKVTWGVYVSTKTTKGIPSLSRMGSAAFSESNPITANMTPCIVQFKNGKAEVQYYLDSSLLGPKDKSFLSSTDVTVVNTDGVLTITNEIFSNFRFEGQVINLYDGYITLYYCRVTKIDIASKTATLVQLNRGATGTISGDYSLWDLGVVNGYDGEVMIEVPEFWVQSFYNRGNAAEFKTGIRLSQVKIDDSWIHQPKVYISAFRNTVLNTVPENMGYLSTLEKGSAVSIVNTNTYCRGGNNDSKYDKYLDTDIFRTNLGKPRTNLSRAEMREACRKGGKEMMNFHQYRNIFYYLFIVERASFDCQASIFRDDNNVGSTTGTGLGSGVTTIDDSAYWNYYNEYNPLIPNGYTLDFSYHSSLKKVTLELPTSSEEGSTASTYTMSVPNWHGFEQPFGDIWTNLDGIILDGDTRIGADIYTTTDPEKYNDKDFSEMTKEKFMCYNLDGWIVLGNMLTMYPYSDGVTDTQIADYNFSDNTASYYRTMLVGGTASDGAKAGIGSISIISGTDDEGFANIGFRSVFEVKD